MGGGCADVAGHRGAGGGTRAHTAASAEVLRFHHTVLERGVRFADSPLPPDDADATALLTTRALEFGDRG